MRLTLCPYGLSAPLVLATACFSDLGSGETDATTSSETHDCGESRRVSIELPLPGVMLVFDKSASMSSPTWDHDGDANTGDTKRWSVLHAVASSIHGSIYTTVGLGLVLFPATTATDAMPETLCQVAPTVNSAVQLWGRDEVVEAMPAAGATLSGMSPIDGGLQRALAHLVTLDPTSPRAMLLVADGAANCKAGVEGVQSGEVFDDGAIATAQAALAAGVRTFVIGLAIPPGLSPNDDSDANPDAIDAFATLQDLAVAGGTAAAYDVQTEAALRAAFDEILTQRLISCENLGVPLFSGEKIVGVALGPDAPSLALTDPCGDGPGWRLSEGSPSAVTLCGATCTSFQAEPTVYFDIACDP